MSRRVLVVTVAILVLLAVFFRQRPLSVGLPARRFYDDNLTAEPLEQNQTLRPSTTVPKVASSTTSLSGTSLQNKQKKVSQIDELGLFGAWGNRTGNRCCDALRSAFEAYTALFNDITQLLPVLHIYAREPDIGTIVELGSRLGSSTLMILHAAQYDMKKRFASVDTDIRQPVRALYECDKRCTFMDFPNREFFTVEGNDLAVSIPFVSGEDDTSRPIDMLFVDTQHNGDQLEMELRRYHKYVRKWIIGHDSMSYRDRDEDPSNRALGHTGPRPVGLGTSWKHFLEEHGDQWAEETNYEFNNGLFVVRKRDVSINDFSAPNPLFEGRMEALGSVKEFVANPRRMHHQARHHCLGDFRQIYEVVGEIQQRQEDSPCHEFPGYAAVTPYSNMYLELFNHEKDVPLGQVLPIIHGQVVGAMSRHKKALLWGCELAPLVAVLHAAAQVVPGHVIQQNSVWALVDPAACDLELEFRTTCGESCVISSNFTVEDFSIAVASAHSAVRDTHKLQEIAQQTRHRLVLYGTSVTGVESAHAVLLRADFTLKMMFKSSVGVAVWERKTSKELLYLPDMKNTQTGE